MPQTPPFDGLAAARSVAARLAALSPQAERDGRLPAESVQALQYAGLLRLWRPESLGGHELSPIEYAEVAEQVARADSAAAWLMMATANTTFDLRWASGRFVDEVFAEPDVIVCETFNRPWQGRAVDGGYRVSGRTAFASGCHHAHWIGHTAVIDEQFLLMFQAADALTIEDDWHAIGMRGTASNSISGEDLFVPAHRVVDFSRQNPSGHFGGPLYRLPEGAITVTFPPVSLGLVAAALDHASEVARRRTPFASSTTLRHRHAAQAAFGRALAGYRAARAFYHQTIRDSFQRAADGGEFALTDKADLFLACAQTLQSCADLARLLARAVGTSAIYQGNPIERALRDTEVIAQHAFGAEARFASVAQVYWDAELDFPLLGMD